MKPRKFLTILVSLALALSLSAVSTADASGEPKPPPEECVEPGVLYGPNDDRDLEFTRDAAAVTWNIKVKDGLTLCEDVKLPIYLVYYDYDENVDVTDPESPTYGYRQHLRMSDDDVTPYFTRVTISADHPEVTLKAAYTDCLQADVMVLTKKELANLPRTLENINTLKEQGYYEKFLIWWADGLESWWNANPEECVEKPPPSSSSTTTTTKAPTTTTTAAPPPRPPAAPPATPARTTPRFTG